MELKLPLASSVFCSQSCFKVYVGSSVVVEQFPDSRLRFWTRNSALKAAWAEHKSLHKPADWQYCTQRGRGRASNLPLYKWSGSLRPFPIGPARLVPDSIPQPDYATTGIPKTELESRQQQTGKDSGQCQPLYIVKLLSLATQVWLTAVAIRRDSKEIEGIKKACRLGRDILDKAHAAIRPGVSTDDIDRVVGFTTLALYEHTCCILMPNLHHRVLGSGTQRYD